MKIGIIGTGLIGFNIAKRLSESDNQIFAYNRTIEKAILLKEYNVEVVISPEELIDKSEIIIGVLTDYNAYLQILSDAINYSGKTFIQMGTLLDKENIVLSEFFEGKNAKFLEAPVLGSKKEAETGKLFVMASGHEEIYKECLPIFNLLSEKPVYVGDIGKASNLKLALNQLIASMTSAFSLSLGIVQRSGIDTELFMNILRGSALYAPTFDKKLNNMETRNFENPNFPTKHLLKDANLIKNTAEHLGLNTEMLNGVIDIIEKSVNNGLEDKDYSAIFNTVVPE